MSARLEVDAHITEADYQALVVGYARMRGWRVAHFRPARTNEGWRTATSYDGHGFPDLTCGRRGQVLFLECKSQKGRVRPEQQAWVDALPNAHIIRPNDWDQVQELLR